MGWLDPSDSTKIPPKSVRLTNITYPIDKNLVPAVLSIRDILWEKKHDLPCNMRRKLEKEGYMVEPSFEEHLLPAERLWNISGF